ncbi:HAMP domain-containing sensor histidine kinase [Leucobacter sp. UT-8R-CII-1-4]|uniref:sensor histidine kinase n=1 Tax=Leucobacter sp. UT-8R-CII-1-4 TaxID=3040075 RepID=UPI0024A95B72|nr:HAMP domain-containing sensor histidine kinase [Leucobacter sp. UT-8R-CII-1-4]MDI6022707.1 HAMP domain-containing sensor histidine kinase [Leucobacter sp. UT-8R-CII-1-4]
MSSAAQVGRVRGVSTKVKLALVFTGILVVSCALVLFVVWAFLIRYIPAEAVYTWDGNHFVPSRRDVLREFVPRVTIAFVGLVAVGLFVAWFASFRVLAPLSQMQAVAEQVRAGDLTRRVNLPGAENEMTVLADSFDTMLDRLEALLHSQQTFVANASHELRTPLASTRALLENASSSGADPDPELLGKLTGVNERAIALVDALLLLHEVEFTEIERSVSDLSLVVEEAVEELIPLASKRGIEVGLDVDSAMVLVSTPLAHQLVSNLVQNAIVHNLDEGGLLDVALSCEADSAVLVIENTGAKLDAEFVAQTRELFVRRGERVRAQNSDHAGLGLGLAIAERIVASQQGELELQPRAEGGLRAVVRFALVPEAAR